MIRLGLLASLWWVGGCSGAHPQKPPERPEKAIDEELAVQLVELFLEKGADVQAMPILVAALNRKPNDPRLHYLMGCALRDRGVYSQAEAELRRALELDPGLVPALGGLGILLDLQGRHEAALARHERAVELAPGVARFHNNQGFSRYLAGDLEGAVAAYEAALRLAPTKPLLFVNLGFALAALGREEEATRMFRQAGGEAAALNNLALARELRGDPERARAMYQAALLKDPSLREALENLGGLDRLEAKAAPGEEE